MKQGLHIDKWGIQRWYKNDELHREDGPAIITSSRTREWWQNGQRHRIDGPAIIYTTGEQWWWQNGKVHREDGPAVIYSNGVERWFIDDKELTKKELQNYLIQQNLKSVL